MNTFQDLITKGAGQKISIFVPYITYYGKIVSVTNEGKNDETIVIIEVTDLKREDNIVCQSDTTIRVKVAQLNIRRGSNRFMIYDLPPLF